MQVASSIDSILLIFMYEWFLKYELSFKESFWVFYYLFDFYKY